MDLGVYKKDIYTEGFIAGVEFLWHKINGFITARGHMTKDSTDLYEFMNIILESIQEEKKARNIK